MTENEGGTGGDGWLWARDVVVLSREQKGDEEKKVDIQQKDTRRRTKK